VLVHSSPGNALLLSPEMERLSPHYTVFAFDTPGFGQSDPLDLQSITLADLADALSETLLCLEMPPCPVFGTHTGAAIALMLGARHPDRVTGLVLDGVPAFTAQECDALFPDYFRELPVSDLGAQYAMAWTRFRDQSIWFPWSARRPDHLNPTGLNTPEQTHLWVSMYFQAAKTYVPPYRAALYSGAEILSAAGTLTCPAVYTASDTDMLFAHLERLPALQAGQEIRRMGTSYAAKRELIADCFAEFSTQAAAPADFKSNPNSPLMRRQYLDQPDGRQTHVRFAGDPAFRPLLLLHDAPGSTTQLHPLIEALSNAFYVVAPDIAGAGRSDPLKRTLKPRLADYADDVADLLCALGLERALVYGIGFGATLAVEVATRRPLTCARLVLEGGMAASPEDRVRLAERYAPAINIEADGAHWYRTWLMLRDSLVWWPWFDRTLKTLRRETADFTAERLHGWTLDVMSARQSYGQFIQAALDHDGLEALEAVDAQLTLVTNGRSPLSVYDWVLQAARPDAAVIDGSGGDVAIARRLLASI
jgi:pimeloyl-ACP methyl ester carboxylesterase